MLLIPCPYCGEREEVEFSYGGPAHISRPPLSASDREWTGYLYHREAVVGPYRERWCHVFGCGRWFNLVRDTTTHQILSVYPIGERGA
jgi:heterotetrameric sarcosine oxidase delta subunit